MPKKLDKWGEWLVSYRFGGDRQLAAQTLARLENIRDKILRNASIKDGDWALDIGSGDGLIGLEVLKFVGEQGKVFFTDISSDALDICEERVKKLNIPLSRTEFVRQSVDNLNYFAEGSLDVITGRAVLMYVDNKIPCFNELFRVLKPGGRLVIFEPINRFSAIHAPNFLDLDFSELDPSLRTKILAPLGYPLDFRNNPMLNFDERDLFDFAEAAGFKEIKIELNSVRTNKVMLQPWEIFIESSSNPLSPPMKLILDSLDPVEKRIATNYLLRAWKRPLRPGYHSEVYLTALKLN